MSGDRLLTADEVIDASHQDFGTKATATPSGGAAANRHTGSLAAGLSCIFTPDFLRALEQFIDERIAAASYTPPPRQVAWMTLEQAAARLGTHAP